MKLLLSYKLRTMLLVGALILVGLLITLLANRDQIERTYQTYQMTSAFKHELAPLRSHLEALGFSELDRIKSQCINQKSPSGAIDPGLTCSASLDGYVEVGNDKDRLAKLNAAAQALSKAFDQNGWRQREDYKTVDWFKAISQNVDYQPDQLNVKQLDDKTCTIDFYTAYSNPKPIAFSLQATCHKPKINFL
jgi:hypothetical protein